MKKTTLSICLALSCFCAMAQKNVMLPAIGATNAKEITIDKVAVSDTATTLYFSAQYWPGTWFRISSASYIVAADKKLVAKSISGMPFDQQFTPENGKVSFTISFPPIDPNTPKIDYIESDSDNSFKIVDIELMAVKKQAVIPVALMGNWFKTEGSKQWLLGLYDNKIVYDNTVWNYGQVKTDGNIIDIKLQHGKDIRELYVKHDTTGIYAGETKKIMQLLRDKPGDMKYAADGKGFTLPVFKNDTAYYNGYINGYSSKLGYKTGQIIINNIVTGGQDAYLISIAADGSFSAKMPMNYPEECFIRIPCFNSNVFIEPGKHLFQFIDITKKSLPMAYMGDNARLNYELDATRYMTFFDYSKVFDNNPDLEINLFKKAVLDKRTNKLADLEKYRADHNLSKKGYELTVLNINYEAAQRLLQVNYLREDAYRKKHNIPTTQRTNAIPPAKLDSTYLSFLKYIDINSQADVVSNDYGNFIRSLKYLDIILVSVNRKILSLYVAELKNKTSLSTEEKQALAAMDSVANSDDQDVINAVYKKNHSVISAIFAKDSVQLSEKFTVELKSSRKRELTAVAQKDISFALEVMNLQIGSENIDHTYIPLTTKQLTAIKPDYKYPYLYQALVDQNTKVRDKIAASIKIRESVANETPKTPVDSAFAEIIKKYKGKAIYVDFWATWCVPCRMGIETIAPIKEDLKNENVVFLYITNQSSPVDAYNNVIKNIKGEHYRVSTDVWNVLASKFNIDGIPHYALVNKNGAVVDVNAMRPEEDDFKTKLLKLVNN
ncbi:TlpA disulfide reductase family protein [Mucilaginibacter sp.]|uniref:TlpA family protein disulfide reductase n=1 Tax=Mucilaginibacter sp. TaxID=1882438 RepID=UPI00262209BC|nr:TlpA disulfide reductase family protein [Mucilaginibacter sp.]MDB4920224.1 hypothetical protein [Mucilaginibacter sp.]